MATSTIDKNTPIFKITSSNVDFTKDTWVQNYIDTSMDNLSGWSIAGVYACSNAPWADFVIAAASVISGTGKIRISYMAYSSRTIAGQPVTFTILFRKT